MAALLPYCFACGAILAIASLCADIRHALAAWRDIARQLDQMEL